MLDVFGSSFQHVKTAPDSAFTGWINLCQNQRRRLQWKGKFPSENIVIAMHINEKLGDESEINNLFICEGIRL